jgi:hypothetical protein
VFGLLKHIRPHLWLNPLLNLAIDGDADSGRFRQVWFKNFVIKLWERQSRFPPELLDFKEGRTEPDVIIEWENPATTVWIEAKFLSGFSNGTVNNATNDQVSRGVRTLLAETGHIRPLRLFELPERTPVWVALTHIDGPKVFSSHLDRQSMCHTETELELGRSRQAELLLGATTWNQVARLLGSQLNRMAPIEASLTRQLVAYLQTKSVQSR